METLNARKIIQALNYFASKQVDREINKMKALKLLWLADRYHARQYARTITGDKCYAMKYGTVLSHTKSILDQLNNENDEYLQEIDKYSYKSKKAPNTDVFSISDIEALDIIFEKYNTMDEFQLSEYTHTLPEWIRYAKSINGKSKKKSYKIRYVDIFLNIDDEKGVFNDDEELLKLTKELFRC